METSPELKWQEAEKLSNSFPPICKNYGTPQSERSPFSFSKGIGSQGINPYQKGLPRAGKFIHPGSSFQYYLWHLDFGYDFPFEYRHRLRAVNVAGFGIYVNF